LEVRTHNENDEDDYREEADDRRPHDKAGLRILRATVTGCTMMPDTNDRDGILPCCQRLDS
jgi:hypothetical protein